MSTGMSLREVRDDFDIPTLKGFNRYWEYSPPMHVLMAHDMGFKKPKKIEATTPEVANELIQMINAGEINGQ